MAVTITGGGAASAGTTSLTPTCPNTVNAGDLLILIVVNKYPTNGPATPSGWIAPANNQYSGGSGASGVDTGSMYVTVFLREADGSEDSTTVTVSIPSGNSGIARIMRATKTSGAKWDYLVRGNPDNSAGTTFTFGSGTGSGASSAMDVKTGDVVVTACAFNSDAYTYSGQSLTGTGLSTGTWTERSDAGTTQGDDCAYNIADVDITGDSGPATLTFSVTASGSGAFAPCGAGLMLRIREEFVGAGTGVLAGFGGSGSGQEAFDATGTAALGAFAASGAGEEQFVATGAGVIGAFGAAGAGVEEFIGSGTGAVSAFGATGVAEEQFIGTGDGALGGFGGSGSGQEAFDASGSGVLGSFGGSGAGEEHFIGTGIGVLDPFDAVGVGVVLNPVAPFTTEFTGQRQKTHDFDAQLNTVVDLEGGRT